MISRSTSVLLPGAGRAGDAHEQRAPGAAADAGQQRRPRQSGSSDTADKRARDRARLSLEYPGDQRGGHVH